MSNLISKWFDNQTVEIENPNRIDAKRIVPFILIHLIALSVFFVGFSWVALWTCVALYFLRMFAITGFYHRYFSHKNFKTSRVVQFIFAFIGAMSAQRGPLWWAAHHRHHHINSDSEADPHSPRHKGFWFSHTLWFLTDANFQTDQQRIRDFAKFPELRWLDRFDVVAPIFLGVVLFMTGGYLETHYPALGVTSWQLLIWGMFVSTVILYHATYTINSLCHKFGSRRFKTNDDSRNNLWLALLTLGEGWHNNHHYYPGTVRQGFKWYELDITFYVLKLMSFVGLVWDLKPIPDKVKQAMNHHPSVEPQTVRGASK